MFKLLTQTKLPTIINKVVVVIGLSGMIVGLFLSYINGQELGWSMFCAAGLGLLFAASAKYIVVKFMRAWMEGKLEQASRERDEAKKQAEALRLQEKEAKAEAKNQV
ncbi:MAG: hypothetical protein PW734_09955 [Verrucomicrobium sp.]|nr:hypothetical protein [Verrucomicrobium sp.]